MANKNRKQTFFDKDEDTEHGLVKRIMLKKYLQAYIAKIQNKKFTLRTILIDGFAGVGRYGNEWPSEIERYGSPLIALMIALGFCYKEDMEKKKQPVEEQEMSKNGKEQAVSEESGIEIRAEGNEMQKRQEESGVQESLEENEMQERPVESGMQEGLVENEMQEISEEIGMRSQETTAACKVQGMLEKKENQNGQGENETQGTSTGVQLLECSNIEETKQSAQKSIWGWQASEMDPEAQLEYELKQWNKRRNFREQLAKIAKMSFIFIENDPKNFTKLSANVELLIMYFLKRFYPSLKYGRRTKKNGTVQLDLNTDPFSISIKIVKGKFAEINPPSMLTDKSVRSLTFLDPFGYTQTPMSHIAKFAPGLGNEVFINFMSSYVNRFVSMSTKGVEELYGIHPPDFKNDDDRSAFVKYVIHFCEPEKEHTFSNEINKCASIYEEFLKRKTNSKYSLTFEVKDKRNTTLYHMIHITNHIRGVESMKDSMKRCSQREGEMIMSEYDIVRKGQKLNLENLDDPIKVAITVLKKYRGMKRVPIADIQEYILFDTNYLFRKTPLIKLQKAGKITDVIDTKGNCQKRKYQFPCKDYETEEPILWLISFADEDCTAEQIVSVAEAEKLRKRKERQETAKKMKEQKEKRKTEKREQKLKEIDERKKKREEERLVKKRQTEDRRRKIKKNQKHKRDEARKQKAEIPKIKDKKSDNEMTSMIAILRSDINQSVGQVQTDNAGKISADAVAMEVDNALGMDKNSKTDDMGRSLGEETSGSGVQTGIKLSQGKDNGRKDKKQRRISGIFLTKKQTQSPLTGTAAERKSFKTRKRKLSETVSNKEEPPKRTVDTSGIVYPSSERK